MFLCVASCSGSSGHLQMPCLQNQVQLYLRLSTKTCTLCMNVFVGNPLSSYPQLVKTTHQNDYTVIDFWMFPQNVPRAHIPVHPHVQIHDLSPIPSLNAIVYQEKPYRRIFRWLGNDWQVFDQRLRNIYMRNSFIEGCPRTNKIGVLL